MNVRALLLLCRAALPFVDRAALLSRHQIGHASECCAALALIGRCAPLLCALGASALRGLGALALRLRAPRLVHSPAFGLWLVPALLLPHGLAKGQFDYSTSCNQTGGGV